MIRVGSGRKEGAISALFFASNLEGLFLIRFSLDWGWRWPKERGYHAMIM